MPGLESSGHHAAGMAGVVSGSMWAAFHSGNHGRNGTTAQGSDRVYEYSGTIARVVDGDTVDADIDLGFGVTIRQRLRLLGIDAPEPRGDTKEEGLRATIHLANLMEDLHPIRIRTMRDRDREKTGKYGRYLAVLTGGTNYTENINQRMVVDGYARKY